MSSMAPRPTPKNARRPHCRFQDALLFGAELLQLDFQQLLQRLRDAGMTACTGAVRINCPRPLRSTPVPHVLDDGRHEKRVPARVFMDQSCKAGGKALNRKDLRQIVGDIGFFQPLHSYFVTQMADQEILFKAFNGLFERTTSTGRYVPIRSSLAASRRRASAEIKSNVADRPNGDPPGSQSTAAAP